MVGDEINDAINLLPLLQMLGSPGGNGGLGISVDLDRVFMMGQSMGGARALAILRELSDGTKYGSLPAIKKVVVRGAVTDFVTWYQAIANSQTVFSYPSTPTVISAQHTGNFGWVYPDDYTEPTDPGYWFYNFFVGGVPAWSYSDPDSDAWPDLGSASPPIYPVSQLYGEEIFYRSATMWDAFWAANDTPVMIMFGKGDNQILWQDGQALYDAMTTHGVPSLYQLRLYEDSDESGPKCAFLGTSSTSHCDHWLVAYDYGIQTMHSWWGVPSPALSGPSMMLLGD